MVNKQVIFIFLISLQTVYRCTRYFEFKKKSVLIQILRFKSSYLTILKIRVHHSISKSISKNLYVSIFQRLRSEKKTEFPKTKKSNNVIENYH